MGASAKMPPAHFSGQRVEQKCRGEVFHIQHLRGVASHRCLKPKLKNEPAPVVEKSYSHPQPSHLSRLRWLRAFALAASRAAIFETLCQGEPRRGRGGASPWNTLQKRGSARPRGRRSLKHSAKAGLRGAAGAPILGTLCKSGPRRGAGWPVLPLS